MGKPVVPSIGIEFDTTSIRAAKLLVTPNGNKPTVKVLGLSELRGDFTNDEAISGGFKKIKEKIGIANGDRITTCLSGKQVFVAQFPFKTMAPGEMKNALKLEIKKSLPFEMSAAAIDFQLLKDAPKVNDLPQYMVTAVPSVLLSRHITMLERLSIKPWVVDVQPLAIANAFELTLPEMALGYAYVVVHIGPAVTNIVIFGDASIPFFHRSVYFICEELFYSEEPITSFSDEEQDKKLFDLTEEITRSISYYRKTNNVANIAGIFLMGDFLDNECIGRAIGDATSQPVEVIDLFSRLKQTSNAPHGKFELAVGLAMRNG